MSEKRTFSALSPGVQSEEKRLCSSTADSSGNDSIFDGSTIIEDPPLSSTFFTPSNASDLPNLPPPYLSATMTSPLSSVSLSPDEEKYIKALLNPIVLTRIAQSIDALITPKLSAQIKQLEEQVREKDKEILELTEKLDSLEQYTRRASIRISGVPETEEESTDDLVRSVAATMGVDLPIKAIDRSHRVGRPNDQSSTSAQRSPRQIIVKLVSYRDKVTLMKNRRELKEKKASDVTKDPSHSRQRIFINEDLTAPRARLAAEARRLKKTKKIDDTWVRDGTIYVKKANRVFKATTEKDLSSIS